MEILFKIVALVADSITAVLGTVAIYALLVHRDKIGAFVKILAHALINERIKRLKGSLGALENLDYDVKEQRKEIFAMLGEVAGMIKGFTTANTGFKTCYEEILRITEAKEGLSESKKKKDHPRNPRTVG